MRLGGIFKVAKLYKNSYSIFVLQDLTEEMRKAMGVSENAQPFESGANSAVFVNDRDNIVAFSDYSEIYNVASEAAKINSSTLPDIYQVQKFEKQDEQEGTFSFGVDYIYAVEMEKLETLNSEDEVRFEKYKTSIFTDEVVPQYSPEDEKMVRAMISLKGRSERDGVEQTDLWAGNVAWSGNVLKYLDLEVIKIGKR